MTRRFLYIVCFSLSLPTFAVRTVYATWWPRGGSRLLGLTLSNPCTKAQTVDVTITADPPWTVEQSQWNSLTCPNVQICKSAPSHRNLSVKGTIQFMVRSPTNTSTADKAGVLIKIEVQEKSGCVIATAFSQQAGDSDFQVPINGGRPF